jgi:hypothetical protein
MGSAITALGTASGLVRLVIPRRTAQILFMGLAHATLERGLGDAPEECFLWRVYATREQVRQLERLFRVIGYGGEDPERVTALRVHSGETEEEARRVAATYWVRAPLHCSVESVNGDTFGVTCSRRVLRVLVRTLSEVAYGFAIPNWEFRTLTNFEREDLRHVLQELHELLNARGP